MTISIAAPRLGDLRRGISGSILTEGEPGWEDATRAFNLTVVQRPRFVALPETPADVVAIVDFAREHGLQLTAQRAGHNAAPLGDQSDLVLVRTDRLQGVGIDPARQVARVAGGAKWGDVVPQASELGLAALHGSTPDVSVAGYSLGGGVGWYARRLGLASNSVTAIELVTADGQLRRVDADHDPDLFWALRGGGGNFGIVTAVEVQLYPVSEVYAGVMFFPWERSDEVLHTWRAWTATVPDEVTSVGRILQFPPLPELPDPLRGQKFALVEAVALGNEAEGRELLEPIRKLGPAMDTFAMVPPAGIAELHMDPPNPVPYTGDGALLGDLDVRAIETFVEHAGPDSGSTLVSAEIRHLGGALSRAQADHGALATLDGSYLTFNVGMVVDEASQAASRSQLDRMHAALAPWSAGRRYLNFTEEPVDSAAFYTAEAYQRLRAVKAQVDPGNLIRANHPILPA